MWDDEPGAPPTQHLLPLPNADLVGLVTLLCPGKSPPPASSLAGDAIPWSPIATGLFRPPPPPTPQPTCVQHGAGSSRDTLRHAGCGKETRSGECCTFRRDWGGEEPPCRVQCTFHGRSLLAPSIKMALRPSHTDQTRHRLRAPAGGWKGPRLHSYSSSTERKVLSDIKHLGGKMGCWGGDRCLGGLTPGWSVPAHCKPTRLQPSRAPLASPPAQPGFLPAQGPGIRAPSVRPLQCPLPGQAGCNQQCDVRTATLTLQPGAFSFFSEPAPAASQSPLPTQLNTRALWARSRSCQGLLPSAERARHRRPRPPHQGGCSELCRARRRLSQP